MPSFPAAYYRALADEMRVIASCTSDERTRQGYLNAAANYDRVAETIHSLEESEARRRRSAPHVA
jgi:hypothetical protein